MWISTAIFFSALTLQQTFLTSGKPTKDGKDLSKAPIPGNSQLGVKIDKSGAELNTIPRYRIR